MVNLAFDYWAVFERGQAARRKWESLDNPFSHEFIEPCDLKLVGSEARAWEDGFERPDFVRNAAHDQHHHAQVA